MSAMRACRHCSACRQRPPGCRPQTEADIRRLDDERRITVLRGWGNSFRTGNGDRKFNQLDTYVLAII